MWPTQNDLSRICFLPINKKAKSAVVAKTVIKTSIIIMLENGNGFIIAETPKIQNILNMFDPTTLPTAMSTFFLYAATAEVASSGKDVPTATTVSPISAWLTPKLLAKATAPSTIHFPPKVNPINPAMIIKVDFNGE